MPHGQTGASGFFRRIASASGIDLHRHIQHGQVMVFHEQYFCTALGLPVLNLYAGVGRQGTKKQNAKGKNAAAQNIP